MECLVKLNAYYLMTYVDFKLNYTWIIDLKLIT